MPPEIVKVWERFFHRFRRRQVLYTWRIRWSQCHQWIFWWQWEGRGHSLYLSRDKYRHPFRYPGDNSRKRRQQFLCADHALSRKTVLCWDNFLWFRLHRRRMSLFLTREYPHAIEWSSRFFAVFPVQEHWHVIAQHPGNVERFPFS
jgi:hypothetical protein